MRKRNSVIAMYFPNFPDESQRNLIVTFPEGEDVVLHHLYDFLAVELHPRQYELVIATIDKVLSGELEEGEISGNAVGLTITKEVTRVQLDEYHREYVKNGDIPFEMDTEEFREFLMEWWEKSRAFDRGEWEPEIVYRGQL